MKYILIFILLFSFAYAQNVDSSYYPVSAAKEQHLIKVAKVIMIVTSIAVVSALCVAPLIPALAVTTVYVGAILIFDPFKPNEDYENSKTSN